MVTSHDNVAGSLRTVTLSIRPYLDDERVIEIMLNGDGSVWVDRAGEGMSATDTVLSPLQAEALLRYVATASRKILTAQHPTFSGTLPHWNARVQGWMPPTVLRPEFNIRKRSSVVYSLDDYVGKGVITLPQRDALTAAVLARKNILVGGGTGTGKTTFANALLRVIAEQTRDRVYIAEDTPELRYSGPNCRLVQTERKKYEMRDAVFDALRARPDRIIVGEIRDGTMLDLLKAWNTGHDGGVATIHANDTSRMLTRVCQLIEEDRKRADREIVADTINVCVHLSLDIRAPAGRRLTGLDQVRGYDASTRRWLLEPLV
jgi:P-type conjugative transfer ATPase TrbB